MHRKPLLPVLRVGAITAFVLAVSLTKPRRSLEAPPEAPAGVWATDIDGAGSLRPFEKARALEGQKKPPCNKSVEREVAGACWIASEFMPPCPAGLYEGQGRCLVPVKASPRLPTSLTP